MGDQVNIASEENRGTQDAKSKEKFVYANATHQSKQKDARLTTTTKKGPGQFTLLPLLFAILHCKCLDQDCVRL